MRSFWYKFILHTYISNDFCFGLSTEICQLSGYEGLTSTKKHDIEHLYAQVMERQLCQEVCADVDVQHPSLKPLLRQYQRQSVWWMLHQERYRPAEENKNLGSATFFTFILRFMSHISRNKLNYDLCTF